MSIIKVHLLAIFYVKTFFVNKKDTITLKARALEFRRFSRFLNFKFLLLSSFKKSTRTLLNKKQTELTEKKQGIKGSVSLG